MGLEKRGSAGHPSGHDRQIVPREDHRWTRRINSATTPTAPPGGNSASATSTESDSNTGNNTGSANTTVNAAALQKVLLAKQVLIGGCENTTGNVYLTGPAPAG